MEQKRNAPCACGSGKKHKHCCMSVIQAKERWHAFADSMQALMTALGTEPRFADDFDRACEQHPDSEEGSVPDTAMEWYVHDYALRDGKTVIELLAEEIDLDGREADALSRWVRSPLSLYEVTGIKRGLGVYLRDAFDGSTCFLHDTAGSLTLLEGTCLFVRIYETGEVAIPSAYPRAVSPQYVQRIAEFVRRGVEKTGHGDVRLYLKENSLAVVLFIDELGA